MLPNEKPVLPLEDPPKLKDGRLDDDSWSLSDAFEAVLGPELSSLGRVRFVFGSVAANWKLDLAAGVVVEVVVDPKVGGCAAVSSVFFSSTVNLNGIFGASAAAGTGAGVDEANEKPIGFISSFSDVLCALAVDEPKLNEAGAFEPSAAAGAGAPPKLKPELLFEFSFAVVD